MNAVLVALDVAVALAIGGLALVLLIFRPVFRLRREVS